MCIENRQTGDNSHAQGEADMRQKHDNIFRCGINSCVVSRSQVFQHDGIDFQRGEAADRHKEDRKTIEIRLAHEATGRKGSKDSRNYSKSRDKSTREGNSDRDGVSGNDCRKLIAAVKEDNYQKQFKAVFEHVNDKREAQAMKGFE